jgi:hypothetical protein
MPQIKEILDQLSLYSDKEMIQKMILGKKKITIFKIRMIGIKK